MYPHERSLVQRLANQPFALLGVNSDSDREALKPVLRQEQITWRSWWDGGSAGGAIARNYRVRAWPTLFLIDGRGVIRARFEGAREIDQEVNALLAEAAARP